MGWGLGVEGVGGNFFCFLAIWREFYVGWGWGWRGGGVGVWGCGRGEVGRFFFLVISEGYMWDGGWGRG